MAHGASPGTARSFVAVAIVAAGFTLAALTASAGGGGGGDDASGNWEAPPRAARKANPIAADEKSIAAGRGVYAAECLDCHGKTGRGDGPAARDLERPIPNITTAATTRQTDGALFWKITRGRDPMPGYEEMLTEEQRWHVVNYLRALARGEGGK